MAISTVWFQSYQFRQINPDVGDPRIRGLNYMEFQSYQFRQINPDLRVLLHLNKPLSSFNRINSGRSIPTWMFRNMFWTLSQVFQSYQFRQINPDTQPDHISTHQQWIGFNRINSGRSIPTRAESMEDLYQHMSEFQSYQFRQINPDSYLWEASRGAVLRG